MSEPTEEARDALVDALVRDLPPPVLPAGFAARVLAAHASAARRRRRLRNVVAAAGLPCALSFAFVMWCTHDVDGDIHAHERTTIALTGATVVAEEGARIHYAVDGRLGRDAIEVEQRIGSAFYRVESGTSFRVRTPVGDVRVHGTCFFVDVPSQEEQMHAGKKLSYLATASASAFVAAALTVVVVEGEVSVANMQGQAHATPGERIVVAHAGAAPLKQLELRAGNDEVVVARAELEALRAAASTTPDTSALVKRNHELEEKLHRADEELALLDEVKRAEEGEALPFPSDLPARFHGDALQRAFEAGMSELGIRGGVLEVDCSEYPCTVYGQLASPDDMRRLREAAALRAYQKDNDNVSLWSRNIGPTRAGERGEQDVLFGVQLRPEGEKLDEIARERQQRRVRDGSERFLPAEDENGAHSD